MRRVSSELWALAGVAALAVLVTGTVTRSRADASAGVAGSSVFKTYCSACHGPEGRGDGPLADTLQFRPPDLTLLAKRNGGNYPAEQVGRIIDGRSPIKGHGGPEMPVWGDAFKNTREGYREEDVKAKIEALVEYLRSVQVAEKK